MKFLGWVLRWTRMNPRFMESFWTTFGSTIYTPTVLDEDKDWGTPAWREHHTTTLGHEMVHILQFHRFGFIVMAIGWIGPTPLFLFNAFLAFLTSQVLAGWIVLGVATLMLPLSVGLSWGRWKLEREGYMVNVRNSTNRRETIDRISKSLWKNYFYTWPPSWSKKWFEQRAAEENLHLD